ncbi:MAG TPA: type II toxin-antitoxin system RatA family toxin [Candidatus Competibacter sp.]|nr:type II toxin-antitoxin system RatA family toxin [Candidatus Competibacteraceae bacterium]HAO32403.1 ubiquinone-binding protein [Candidatus Competibacteraceae bacterium]HUM95958.1 type II toxin-antitoxin system RatA family toxin [Candidatus Competibacter sp.]
MATVNKSALVLYSAAEMYRLVEDIEAYPKFLPWCRSARILDSSGDEVRATIEMAKGGVHKSFTTRNRMQQHQSIDIRLLEGPFERLEGFWRFEALRVDASKVSLDMEFEFASTLLRMAVEPVFKQITNSLVDAFCKRAVDVYGKR